MATKASKRIYLIELSDDTGPVIPVRLVRASHRNIALAHVVRPIASVSIPSQDELVALLTHPDSPVAVEDADDGQEDEPKPGPAASAEPAARATQLPKVEWPIPHPGGDWPKPKTGEAA